MSEPVSPQTSDASPTAVAPITAARSNESMRVMGAKVRVRRGPRHYQPPLSVGVRTEDDLLGERWHMKNTSAHQHKLRLPADLVDVIEVKQMVGALDSLACYVRPIERAMAAAPRSDAEYREEATDADEDRAQADYRRNPCVETARPLLRIRAVMRQASMDHDLQIATRWGLTP